MRRAEVNQARAQLRQSELLYRYRKNGDVEARTPISSDHTKGNPEIASGQLAFAAENYNAVTRQFDFGLASSLDVLDANNLLVSAQRQLANAEYGYQLAIFRLKRTTGLLLAGLKNK